MLVLKQTTKLGLEVFQVWHGETMVGQYMSYQLGWTAFKRLESKLMRGIK